MPTTIEGTNVFQSSGVLFAPGKAANAGGVATSALEMTQNSMRLPWTFEEVDEKLHQIMINIYKQCEAASEEYGFKDNFVADIILQALRKWQTLMMAQEYCLTDQKSKHKTGEFKFPCFLLMKQIDVYQ